MFKKVSSCLEVYSKSLKMYIEKLEEMKVTHGNSDFLSWNKGDYNFVMEWNRTFKVVEHILGLSEKEAKQHLNFAQDALGVKRTIGEDKIMDGKLRTIFEVDTKRMREMRAIIYLHKKELGRFGRLIHPTIMDSLNNSLRWINHQQLEYGLPCWIECASGKVFQE